MITYKKGCSGLFLLLRIAGTSWPHGIVPGLLSAGLGVVLGFAGEANALITNESEFSANPYPYQLFAYLVGFVLVFRTNFGYLRYWDALDAIQRMGAKWLDGACMAIAFDAPGDVSSPFLQQSFRAANVSGICSAELDGDVTREESITDPKNQNLGLEHPYFFEEVVHLFSLMHALAYQHLRCDDNLDNLRPAAIPRLLMVGDEPVRQTSVSCQSWGFAAKDRAPLRWPLRMKVLGGLQNAERVVLECDSTGVPLPSLARVTMVESWIMRRLTARQKHEPAGDMCRTAAPILSRMVQVISDGHLAFSQAAKVAETPFPFPYHNLISLFLWIFAVSTPVVVNANLIYPPARFLVNFFAVWAYFSLAEVGDNLEDPYIPYDPNDLPLEALHQSFNSRLLSFGAVPGVSPLPGPASPMSGLTGARAWSSSTAPATA
eukprot:CAMPEP_0171079916 /NCGR_PEP_ID=MMETSP0766_2-20121228/15548_1 /TAXON_ID=439317 /ORGANISM="Gambierdiscus australes, Strain CAWD 149" /LENGTH=432 /DNA_ID=CAMNT_0011537125 /DNA_START=43 /DNA_END=1338 /DNA_ORIENTATION=+